METSHLLVGSLGIGVGFWIRHLFVVKEEPQPCQCLCNCAFSQAAVDSGGSWGNSGLILGLVIATVVLIANLAVACKISWVSKGDAKELSLVVSHQKGQGKSRGVFSPTKGLQITGP